MSSDLVHRVKGPGFDEAFAWLEETGSMLLPVLAAIELQVLSDIEAQMKANIVSLGLVGSGAYLASIGQHVIKGQRMVGHPDGRHPSGILWWKLARILEAKFPHIDPAVHTAWNKLPAAFAMYGMELAKLKEDTRWGGGKK